MYLDGCEAETKWEIVIIIIVMYRQALSRVGPPEGEWSSLFLARHLLHLLLGFLFPLATPAPLTPTRRA